MILGTLRGRVVLGCILPAALLFLAGGRSAGAAERETLAENLTGSLRITGSAGGVGGEITDDNIRTYASFGAGETITLESDAQIGGLYIMWNRLPGEWSYTADGITGFAGEKDFLHEYVELEEPCGKIVLNLPGEGAQITDVYAFSPGTPPDWVQVWEEPCESADLLLFSTHSDDEQLFFAGILPYYAIERRARVQVVYGTNHRDSVTRPHEQLNGLWTVGIRNYPVIAPFPDDARSLGSVSESRETVLERARGVYDEEKWIRFEVEMLRRFRPQVVVGHDVDGEYRHGAHILNTDALMQALPLAKDASYDPQSAETYGTWDVPKTYLHLYGENQVVMDWDTPYESMGGKTAFEMSKQGYACHLSQQWTWFTGWVSKEKASDIKTYSPCRYGLYRSNVGEDVRKDDFLENITTYREQEERLAEEERLAREESERRERERLAREESERKERERLAREESERRERERLAQEERQRQEESLRAERNAVLRTGTFFGAAVLLTAGLTAALLRARRGGGKRRRR